MNPLTKRIILSPHMWFAAAQVTAAKALGKQFAHVSRSGLNIICGTQDGQGSYCAVAGPTYEPELAWLLGELSPDDIFVDVGANIGIYSLYAAQRLKGHGHVFAIEPSPDAVNVLRQNVTLNSFASTISVAHAAASRDKGQLYLAGDPTKWNSLQLHATPPGTLIEVTTVDSILAAQAGSANFHFLKIDAEGVETDVLAGAQESIQNTWPTIIFENTINRSNELPAVWLSQRGYTIHAINPRGRLIEVLPANYERHTNLVATHPRSRKS